MTVAGRRRRFNNPAANKPVTIRIYTASLAVSSYVSQYYRRAVMPVSEDCLFAAIGMLPGRVQRHDLAGRGRFAEPRPGVHELASFVEQIASAIGALDRISDSMRERHLGDLRWEASALSAPIAKAGTKTVRCHITTVHATQQHQQRGRR
jgi:hypothetical protein